MNSIDKLKLLAGVPIEMSDFTCLVYPFTLKDIAILGSEKFFKYLNLLTISKEEVKRVIGKESVSSFDFILLNCVGNDFFKNEFMQALKIFIREDILLVPDLECFIIGKFEDNRTLNKNNFNEFQFILQTQNFLTDQKVEFRGEDEIARRIKEKLEKGRKKIQELKNLYDENKIELADLIASLAVNSSLNIDNIWNISYYAFNDQFKRMRILEQYNTGLQSIMAGADPKKINLQDWIQSIQ